MMNVFMPLAYGKGINHRVVSALASQTFACDLFVHYHPCSNPNSLLERRRNEAENRNQLRAYANGTFSMYLDSDVVLSKNSDVTDMACFLLTNQEYDAVAIDTKGSNLYQCEKSGHVIIACIMVRNEKLLHYTFIADENNCCCIDFNRHMRIKYIDDRRAYEV